MTRENGHMEIWNQVCQTEPSTTRPVEYGRRKFTAIDAQFQRKRATEIFGPYGTGWGLREFKWEYIRNAKGEVVELTLDAIFWYEFKAGEMEFPISVDHAYKPGDDIRKKLITDATTKALSFLGFNSDVFEGKFDDNKYVEKESFKEVRKKKFEEIVAALRGCKDQEQLDKYVLAYKDGWKTEFSEYYQSKIEAEVEAMSTLLQGEKVF